MGLLRAELEKVKQEKEGFEFKIAKFDKSAKDLEQLLASQIIDKSKKGFGYNAIPSPHPLILNRPIPLDLSYLGLEEFKEHEVNEYGTRDSSLKPIIACDKGSNNSKENTDDSLEQHQKTGTEKSSFKVDKDWKEKFFCPANHVREEEPKKVTYYDEDEPNPKVEKKTVIPTATKKEFIKLEKPVRRSIRTAEVSTDTDGEVTITAIIDGQSKTITEASLRRHLKLEDHDGITSIPNSEIFEQLALMGYQADSDKLTFQKGVFSHLMEVSLYILTSLFSLRRLLGSNLVVT
ncbi:hypothetical protein Tco_0504675 [Tanacetum coccineum]